MTAATFILMHKDQIDGKKAKEIVDFFEWSYAQGDKHAIELDYIPMPDSVVSRVEEMLTQELVTNGQPILKN